jgi:hypothetical protein
MRTLTIITAFVIAGCMHVPQTHDEAAASASIPAGAAKPAAIDGAAPASAMPTQGLGDLDAMTFDCPKAGLNAAAREAAKVPSQGTYQFSYFRIVNDAHHAAYEVHFSSNYVGEPVLRYCVLMYCQQGWNPNTTRIDVKSTTGDEPACSAHADATKRRSR